jgi:hypothetical protein
MGGGALLQAAGGLEHHQAGVDPGQAPGQLLQAVLVVADRKALVGAQDVDIEPGLADVDPDEGLDPIHALYPPLQVRARCRGPGDCSGWHCTGWAP